MIEIFFTNKVVTLKVKDDKKLAISPSHMWPYNANVRPTYEKRQEKVV